MAFLLLYPSALLLLPSGSGPVTPPQQICFQLHATQLQNTWDHQRGYQIYLLKLCDNFWVTLEFSEKMMDNTAQSADTEAMI